VTDCCADATPETKATQADSNAIRHAYEKRIPDPLLTATAVPAGRVHGAFT
jgi:hypothetical protein